MKCSEEGFSTCQRYNNRLLEHAQQFDASAFQVLISLPACSVLAGQSGSGSGRQCVGLLSGRAVCALWGRHAPRARWLTRRIPSMERPDLNDYVLRGGEKGAERL